MSESLADILGDPRDFIDTDSMSDELRDGRERDEKMLTWATKKPAMDAGLIPYEPKPVRYENYNGAAKVRARRMCQENPALIRQKEASQEYGVTTGQLRSWWTYGIIDGVTLYDGSVSTTVYYRADIERAIKTVEPGDIARHAIQDDDGIPARIASAAQDFRKDAYLFGNRVANGASVAADSEGRSRHCRHGRGSHGCEPDFAASRVGKERRAREATLTNQEVA